LDSTRIAELLQSYTVGLSLPPIIYEQLGAYLQLLLRWNAKTNLSAIRDPEQIVSRHFGESLFAAGVLFGAGTAPASSHNRQLTTDNFRSGAPLIPSVGMSGIQDVGAPSTLSLRVGGNDDLAFPDNRQLTTDNFHSGAPLIPSVGMSGIRHTPHLGTTLADLGSGAGFPGLPIKLAFPTLHVTLIESQNKKATFLKEVIRALQLDGIEVYSGRAERWGKQAEVVTQRAVEKFEAALPIAAGLVHPGGRLCLLIGAGQSKAVKSMTGFEIEVEREMPERPETVVLVGSRGQSAAISDIAEQ
jgi:16S rRNA (guanine(527)-N(7))-methyltransferase RsmG